MVLGTVTNAEGKETGVTVNGMRTVVSGGRFAANHVFLNEGENTVTAVATDMDGNTASASIKIYRAPSERYIGLTADEYSGVAPFETELEVEGEFQFTDASITYTGPGDVEFIDNPDEDEYTVRITTPGMYYFTAEVEDAGNNIYTDTIAIEVMDQSQLDALLTAKWEGMRQALAQNDIDAAISYFHDSTKSRYKKSFAALSSVLTQIAQELDDIQFIRMMYNSAEYDVQVERDGKIYSFYILFEKDNNGIWKIRSF